MHRAALGQDESAFCEATKLMLGTRGGSFEVAVLAYVRRCFAPIFEVPFHMDRAYATEVVRSIQDLKKFMFAKDKSFTAFPPGLVFMNRLQFGFYSVLAQLDVAVDYAAVEREILVSAGLLD